MKMNKKIKTIAFASMAIGTIVSCSPELKNRTMLSDAEMSLAMRKLEKMEMNFMLYREGSSGANGGKSGGGCGCN